SVRKVLSRNEPAEVTEVAPATERFDTRVPTVDCWPKNTSWFARTSWMTPSEPEVLTRLVPWYTAVVMLLLMVASRVVNWVPSWLRVSLEMLWSARRVRMSRTWVIRSDTWVSEALATETR